MKQFSRAFKYPTGVIPLHKEEQPAAVKSKKPSKYHNRKQLYDNIEFDSMAEVEYYKRLMIQKIDFKYHQRFEICPRFKIKGKTKQRRVYTPDFTIYEGNELIEAIDIKGMKTTADASLRMNLFMQKYNVPVMVARYDRKTHEFKEKLAWLKKMKK